MITGFSYDTKTKGWQAIYEYKSKGMTKSKFKQLYENGIGLFIKVGKREIYLTESERQEFEKTREKTMKQFFT